MEVNAMIQSPSRVCQHTIRRCQMCFPGMLEELAKLREAKGQIRSRHVHQVRDTTYNAAVFAMHVRIHHCWAIELRQAHIRIERRGHRVVLPHIKGTQHALSVPSLHQMPSVFLSRTSSKPRYSVTSPSSVPTNLIRRSFLNLDMTSGDLQLSRQSST